MTAAHAEHPLGNNNAPDLAKNHRLIATYLESWANALINDITDRREPRSETDFMLGYQRALRDLASHLADGDALPGGPLAVPVA
ncbi:hypothetical protein [Dermatophilus congolensis]|uniref:Uncharacterized protein n=1 Tax=Dermatophilus congolensis TaxID=1863 RepID=A0AA46BPN2_9MICO|nr:hypothetical protein [Dermatophilus congolensis]MBO3143612.1 hypothetical protein [Dermatophilus congolensis]MBO3152605.1 hypothetical protein [Dermatophilus congolensis]MBO3160384.1 hypothetical protein [Dermatophilus congolensis]MBO3163889.1 hypothetical protein [Dermatophilus congolensis]MBO3177436.1 hypothetical protein [Dermatophilus congolensis]